jgi:hypothetical protein
MVLRFIDKQPKYPERLLQASSFKLQASSAEQTVACQEEQGEGRC